MSLRIEEWLDQLRHRLRAGQFPETLTLGRRAEDLAHRHLEKRGYIVLERNWRPAGGAEEVDLIALESGELVFVEVKARASAEFGSPERAMDDVKRMALTRAAQKYLRSGRLEMMPFRFDLVTVVFEDPVRIEVMPSAFTPHHSHAVS